MDWGTPGIFGWYASGDDGKREERLRTRLPSIAGAGNFTSFIGDGNLAWGTLSNGGYDMNLTYAGTLGVIGLQLADMSFVEDLKHTFRVAYWGGTNSPSMVKYMNSSYAWNSGAYNQDGPYLTTNDGLLEFNLVNSYQIYENLEANLEAGLHRQHDRPQYLEAQHLTISRASANRTPGKPSCILAYTF